MTHLNPRWIITLYSLAYRSCMKPWPLHRWQYSCSADPAYLFARYNFTLRVAGFYETIDPQNPYIKICNIFYSEFDLMSPCPCSARFADKVSNSSAFHARLGESWGLSALGMFNKGIIWNNNTPGWKYHRKFFMQCKDLTCIFTLPPFCLCASPWVEQAHAIISNNNVVPKNKKL